MGIKRTTIGLVFATTFAPVRAQVLVEDRLIPYVGGSEQSFRGVDIDGHQIALARALVASGSGTLLVVDARDGSLVSSVPPTLGLLARNVRLSGDILMGIGLVQDPEPSPGVSSNALFFFDALTGQHLRTITNPEDPGNWMAFQDLQLRTFDVSAPLAACIGASPASPDTIDAVVYVFDVTDGTLVTRIAHPFISFTSHLAVDGTRVMVSGFHPTTNSNVVLMFDAITGDILRSFEIFPNQLSLYAHSVALAGSTAIVGSDADQRTSPAFYPSVTLYDTDSDAELAHYAPEYEEVCCGGIAKIATNGPLAVLANEFEAVNGQEVGQAHLLDAQTGGRIAKLRAASPQANAFGMQAAMSAQHIAILSSLGVHVFDLATACSPADLTADGVLNFDDIDAFVAAYLAADLLADCNGSGVINLDDIDCFAAAFLAGCP